jgi:hypothetical protein
MLMDGLIYASSMVMLDSARRKTPVRRASDDTSNNASVAVIEAGARNRRVTAGTKWNTAMNSTPTTCRNLANRTWRLQEKASDQFVILSFPKGRDLPCLDALTHVPSLSHPYQSAADPRSRAHELYRTLRV